MAHLPTMESVELRLFDDEYCGRRILITGHTGFKGSWLSAWLHKLGANVQGVSLDPNTSPNHWELLNLDITDHRVDIRNFPALAQIINQFQPEIVFHLAAQPLVRRSYHNPLETWSTNTMGTANLLEACRGSKSVQAIVVITTDKCYENREQTQGYKENDRLGGHDPYSASKAAAELVANSYRQAFFHLPGSPLLATARAGNVIGGGDWSEDRLIPDLVRSIAKEQPLEIRSPNATRPWQHVLESLGGYLLLGQKLMQSKRDFAEAWNFGPEPEDNRTVAEVLTKLKSNWPKLDWVMTKNSHPHEAGLLYLDSTKAHSQLSWIPTWSLDTALVKTAEWYKAYLSNGHIDTQQQLDEFVSHARSQGREWAN